jgi:hypothetical protein
LLASFCVFAQEPQQIIVMMHINTATWYDCISTIEEARLYDFQPNNARADSRRPPQSS